MPPAPTMPMMVAELALSRSLIGGLDRLRKQLAEGTEIRSRNGQHAREWSKSDDVDEDQRPDQDIDATEDIEHAPHGKVREDVRHHVLGRQKTHGKRQH